MNTNGVEEDEQARHILPWLIQAVTVTLTAQRVQISGKIIMIESIHIKNFRGIQDGKIDKFSKINLLVGPNNSGKSAVLETIYLLNTSSKNHAFDVDRHLFDGAIADVDLLGDDPLDRICLRHAKKTAKYSKQSNYLEIFSNNSRLHIPAKSENTVKMAMISFGNIPVVVESVSAELAVYLNTKENELPLNNLGSVDKLR